MRTFFAGLVVLPCDQHVAARWGELQPFAQLRGRPRPANDSWIAACCLVRELPLATFNTKDFADFAEHEGLQHGHDGLAGPFPDPCVPYGLGDCLLGVGRSVMAAIRAWKGAASRRSPGFGS